MKAAVLLPLHVEIKHTVRRSNYRNGYRKVAHLYSWPANGLDWTGLKYGSLSLLKVVGQSFVGQSQRRLLSPLASVLSSLDTIENIIIYKRWQLTAHFHLRLPVRPVVIGFNHGVGSLNL